MYIPKALISLVLAASTISAAALPQPSSPAPASKDDCKDVKHYFSFGASFTQTGFNENLTQPSLENPMGNPMKPVTFTGGENYVSFLTKRYNSSSVLNYDFARGGATTSRKIVATGPESTTFEEQVLHHFLPKYGGANKTWTSDSAFISIHFGINDITIPLTSKDTKVPDRFTRVPDILSAYFTYVDKLYTTGMRKFMVINVPPQDRTPMVKKLGAAKRQEFKDFIIEFNAQLLNRTREFAKTHEGAYMASYDANAFFSKVLDDPKAHGFPDATCIDAKGQKCIWFNDFHPSEKFDDLWSARMKIAMDSLGYNGSAPTSGYYA